MCMVGSPGYAALAECRRAGFDPPSVIAYEPVSSKHVLLAYWTRRLSRRVDRLRDAASGSILVSMPEPNWNELRDAYGSAEDLPENPPPKILVLGIDGGVGRGCPTGTGAHAVGAAGDHQPMDRFHAPAASHQFGGQPPGVLALILGPWDHSTLGTGVERTPKAPVSGELWAVCIKVRQRQSACIAVPS